MVEVQDSCHWPERKVVEAPANHKPPASSKRLLIIGCNKKYNLQMTIQVLQVFANYACYICLWQTKLDS